MPDNPFAPIWKKVKSKKMVDKITNIRPFPLVVDIELTNNCNLKCRMCPNGQGKIKRPKGFMSSKTYAAIISECSLHGAAIRFVRWGEPTLHPKLLHFVQAAKASGILTHINTNGSLIDSKFVGGIIRIPLDSIKISLQGLNANDYKYWRGIDNFDNLINIAKDIKRKRGKRQKPYITLGTTTKNASPDRIREFKSNLKEYADRVTVGLTKDLANMIGNKPECPEVFDKLSVNWDGTVSACCADYDNKMLVGNIHDQKLKTIWDFSEDLWYIRESLANNRHEEFELCRRCYL